MRTTLIQAVSLVVWLIPAALCGQEPDAYQKEMDRWDAEEKRHIAQLFKIKFDQHRAGEPSIIIEKNLLLKHPGYTLELLDSHSKDPNKRIRYACAAHAWQIGVAHRPVTPIRKEVVRQLVDKCFDLEGSVWQPAARWLLDFDEQDFTSDVVKTLGDNVIKDPIRDDVLLVVGVANLFILENWLKSIEDKHFFAVLALARLGDDDAARHAVAYVKQKGTRPGMLNPLLGRLAYTRHPLVLDYLEVYLNRDDGGITRKESGDYSRPPYSKVTLEALAKHWPNFPVKKNNPYKYTDADLQAAREWARNKLRKDQP